LKEGGEILIGTPYNEDLKRLTFRCPHCQKTFHKNCHQHSFDEAKMYTLLRAGGFTPYKTIFVCNTATRRIKQDLFKYRLYPRFNKCWLFVDQFLSLLRPQKVSSLQCWRKKAWNQRPTELLTDDLLADLKITWFQNSTGRPRRIKWLAKIIRPPFFILY
jgi:hypothetical protein